jgi:hypothetical protein
MNGEASIVSLIVTLRFASLDVLDPAAEGPGDSRHDLGLRAPQSALNAGQVARTYLGGFGESAQAVATQFALPLDFRSIGLHVTDATPRPVTKQREAQRKEWKGGEWAPGTRQ